VAHLLLPERRRDPGPGRAVVRRSAGGVGGVRRAGVGAVRGARHPRGRGRNLAVAPFAAPGARLAGAPPLPPGGGGGGGGRPNWEGQAWPGFAKGAKGVKGVKGAKRASPSRLAPLTAKDAKDASPSRLAALRWSTRFSVFFQAKAWTPTRCRPGTSRTS